MRAELSEQNVIKASAQFWEQMLAMQLEPIVMDAAICWDGRHVCGIVALSGVWNGQIEVRLSASLAREATAAMLMQPIEDVSDGDMLDATKEIANMIAGVVKSSLPRPCTMAIPTATIERELFRPGAGECDLVVVPFRHAKGEMVIRIWEHDCRKNAGDGETILLPEA